MFNMVKYVCNTCLYVNDNRSAFKKMNSIKPVLELFIPETVPIKDNNSLICEQCYFFLKTVETFKMRCKESQRKFSALNISKLKDKTAATVEPKLHSNNSSASNVLSNSFNKSDVARRIKVPKTAKYAKLSSLQATVEKPDDDIGSKNSSWSTNNAPKQFDSLSDKNDSIEVRDDIESIKSVVDDDEDNDDYYVTRHDLVAAGILPEYVDSKSMATSTNSEFITDLEADLNAHGSTESSILKKSLNNFESPAKKKKVAEDDIGILKTQFKGNSFKCTLCSKRCKSYEGVEKHSEDYNKQPGQSVHCDYCNFSSLEKSVLLRHYDVCHQELKMNTSPVKCGQCSLNCESMIDLSIHQLNNHCEVEQLSCNVCSARFSDGEVLTIHMEKEHLDLERNYCLECVTLFLTYENFQEHMTEKHQKLICRCCKHLFDPAKKNCELLLKR